MAREPIVLDGESLDLPSFVALARHGAPAALRSFAAVEAGRAWLDEHVAAWREGRDAPPIYGVTTGFGSLRNVAIPPEDAETLQVNLIRSHALGAWGQPAEAFDDEIVRGALALRLNTFLAGRSGVRRELVELLLAMLREDVLPRVPQRGSVGASGDLCPLAHFALVLIGEGEASVPEGAGRAVLPGAEALARAGLQPLRLSYKEGLALINGTTFSTACLALAIHDAEAVARTADVACALSFEALGACGRALDPQVHASRRQPGQADSARSLRALTMGSRRLSSTDDRQDPYSLRCAPQVHGASRDALAHARFVVEAELNAVTDNPLLFALEGDALPWDLAEHADNPRRFGREPERTRSYSAGNFHGQPVAIAADLAALAVAELADVAERRLALLVSPAFSRGLPAHLASGAGLSSGLMLAQYSAASLVSEARTLAHPASVDSIPTGNGAEDHVSMSTWAARKARMAVALATQVVALELLAAAQANEWRCVIPDPLASAPPRTAAQQASLDRELATLPIDAASKEMGAGTSSAQLLVRSLSGRLVEDRSLAADVARIAQAVRAGRFVETTGPATLPLRRVRHEPAG